MFTSHSNRHTLPLFTSLLNTVCGYQPAGGLPYNHLLWGDSKEQLVQVQYSTVQYSTVQQLVQAALQVLIVSLDPTSHPDTDNLFLNYLAR